MRMLLIQDTKIVGTLYADSLAEAVANNPDLLVIEDTTGVDDIIGMTYIDGVLSGEPLPKPAPLLPTVADFTNALTRHLDATAQQRKYDNRITCMVRAGFPGPFQAEGMAFAEWADLCNATAYTLLAEVQAGTRPIPANTQELIDVMPAMVWPTI